MHKQLYEIYEPSQRSNCEWSSFRQKQKLTSPGRSFTQFTIQFRINCARARTIHLLCIPCTKDDSLKPAPSVFEPEKARSLQIFRCSCCVVLTSSVLLLAVDQSCFADGIGRELDYQNWTEAVSYWLRIVGLDEKWICFAFKLVSSLKGFAKIRSEAKTETI